MTHRCTSIQSQSGPGSNSNEEYATFSKAPKLDPHHHAVLCPIQDTHWWGGLTPLQSAYSIAVAMLYNTWRLLKMRIGGARGVMVIVVGKGHGDMSSNPGWDWLHFT